MSIDVLKPDDVSGYGKAITGFKKIRDMFDGVVKILELLQAAEYLYTEDLAFLDEKLDELKVRAEEIRIEKLKKPEYNPPASKPKKKGYVRVSGEGILRRLEEVNERYDAIIRKMEDREKAKDAIEPEFDGADHEDDVLLDNWWRNLQPGDYVYSKTTDGVTHKFEVRSIAVDKIYLKHTQNGIYYTLRARDIMLYLAPSEKYLNKKHKIKTDSIHISGLIHVRK